MSGPKAIRNSDLKEKAIRAVLEEDAIHLVSANSLHNKQLERLDSQAGLQ